MKKYIISIVILIVVVLAGKYLWKAYEQKQYTSAISGADTLIASAIYTCDKGKTVSASYYEGPEAVQPQTNGMPAPTGKVQISLGGGASMNLNQTISGSGVRYANLDESFVFWNKGNEALIMRNNAMDLEYTNCNATTTSIPNASPEAGN